MSDRLRALVLTCRAHGVDGVFVAIFAATLALAVVSSRLSIALSPPNPGEHEVIGSGLVAGCVLPVSVLATTVHEPGRHLLQTAARSAVALRLRWLAVVTALVGVAALVIGWLVPAEVNAALVRADTVLLSGCALLSVLWMGHSLSWVLPLLIAVAASVPGVVPIELNVLHVVELLPHTVWLGAVLYAAAATLYCVGLTRKRRSRDTLGAW